jgi:addiction module RelE/StbE family toxin
VWRIEEHRTLEKAVAGAPLQVREKYEFWKDVVRQSGPAGLILMKGFRDHALLGKWKGRRSSSLSESYRVVYSVESDQLLVRVERVSKHDYRKRKA